MDAARKTAPDPFGAGTGAFLAAIKAVKMRFYFIYPLHVGKLFPEKVGSQAKAQTLETLKFNGMLPRLSLFFLLLGSYLGLKADTYYFMVDPSCMDRLKYSMSSGSSTIDQTLYHYDLRSGAKLILELAPGEGELTRQLSGKQVTCGANLVNKSNYEMVGSPAHTKYVAIPKPGGQYQIIPVMMINYMESNDNMLVYKDWQNAFAIPKNQAQPGTVVNPNDNTGSKITLQNTSRRNCLTEYNLRQTFSFDPNASIQIVFIPEIGIIQKTSNTSNQALVSYNDKSLDQAIQGICQSGSPVVNTPPPTTEPAPPQQPSQRMHTVNSGETLFSISRQYNVSVDEIKQWNNLTSNTISPNMELAVSAPAASPAPTTAVSPSDNWQARTPYPDQSGYKPTTSEPFTTSAASTPPKPELPAWQTTNGTHLVLPGETVASIAKKYGYTEDRFRDMNDLQPYENVRVNQTLKTTDRLTSPAAGAQRSSQGFQSFSTSQSNLVVPFEPYGEGSYSDGQSPYSGQQTMSPKGGTEAQPRGSGSSPAPNSLDFYQPSASGSSPSTQNTSSYYQPGAGSPTGSGEPSYSAAANTSSYYNPSPASSGNNTNTSMTSNGVQFTAKGMAADEIAKPMARPSDDQQTQRGDGTHLVQPGESLASISQKYGLTVEELRQINNLKPGEIVIPYERIYVRR